MTSIPLVERDISFSFKTVSPDYMERVFSVELMMFGVSYLKDGKLMKEKAPEFGAVNFIYNDGKVVLLERKE